MSDTEKEPEYASDEHLSQLARSLGFGWPEDREAQWETMKRMAIMGAHWREKVEECEKESYKETSREKLYQHQQRRYLSTLRKLRNVRTAMKQFMVDQVAWVRIREAEYLENLKNDLKKEE